MNIHTYSVALLSSLKSVKSTKAISEEANKSKSSGSRFLNSANLDINTSKSAINNLFGKKKLTLVVDDFTISRRYATNTEGISPLRDSSTKTFTLGTSFVAGGVTDSKYFLPLDLEQWVEEAVAQLKYLSKPQLAKILVNRILTQVKNIKYATFDGLYFNKYFIKELDQEDISFVIKAKTTTSVIWKNQKIQLRNCPALRLNNNQNCKKIIAEWDGKLWHFIAVRYVGKRGTRIVYLIANFEAKSKKYAKIYASRWPIEKFIRTGKQFIGLNNSQSQQAKTYLNHIRCVFYAYGILQKIMKKFRLSSAEEALHKIQALKFKLDFHQIFDWVSLFINYA